jgi:hypothetical protein
MPGPEEAARKTRKRSKGDPADTEANTKDKAEYIFNFRFEAEGGRVYEGTFTNHVLTNTQRLDVAVAAARMRQGMPAESLDLMANIWLEKMAHMAISLPQDERPEWAQDLGALYDDTLITALYKEVLGHEATFHGRGEDQKEGAV